MKPTQFERLANLEKGIAKLQRGERVMASRVVNEDRMVRINSKVVIAVKAVNKKDRIADSFNLDPGALKSWFDKQIQQAAKYCEECGAPLAASLRFIPTAIVAHIFPKRKEYGYPGVATHDQNRMFFCVDCHTNFDNKGKSFIINMQSFDIIKMRAIRVYSDMSPEEQRRAIKNLDYLLI